MKSPSRQVRTINVVEYVEPGLVDFLGQEIFSDLTAGERREVDILAKVKFKEGFVWTTPEGAMIPQRDGFFLIHLENQSYAQSDFARRMFHYFARLDEKHSLPVFPVVIFSYDEPKRQENDTYKVVFPSGQVLEFKYTAIQLNRIPKATVSHTRKSGSGSFNGKNGF